MPAAMEGAVASGVLQDNAEEASASEPGAAAREAEETEAAEPGADAEQKAAEEPVGAARKGAAKRAAAEGSEPGAVGEENEERPAKSARGAAKKRAAAAEAGEPSADDGKEEGSPAKKGRGGAAKKAGAAKADRDDIPSGQPDDDGAAAGVGDQPGGDGAAVAEGEVSEEEAKGLAVVQNVLKAAKAKAKAKAAAKAAAKAKAKAAVQADAKVAAETAALEKTAAAKAKSKAKAKARARAEEKAQEQAEEDEEEDGGDEGDEAATAQAAATAASQRAKDKRESLGRPPAKGQTSKPSGFAVDQFDVAPKDHGDVGDALVPTDADEDDFECDHLAGMNAQAKAKFYRGFAAALRTPAAEQCGMAAMAAAIRLLPRTQKRAAKTALAKNWHLHGCVDGQYEVVQELSRTKGSKSQSTLAPKCIMIGICGSAASFAEGLACGDLEEVKHPETGQLLYRYTIHKDSDVTEASKRMRAGNPEAQELLNALVAPPDFQATGRSCLPSMSAASAAQTPPLAVEDASVEIKLKLKLEQNRVFAEKHLYATKQTAVRLEAEAGSVAQKHILSVLKEALAQCEGTTTRIAEACAKWTIGRMTADDPPIVEELLKKVKTHFENLSEWNKAAEGVRSKKLIP